MFQSIQCLLGHPLYKVLNPDSSSYIEFQCWIINRRLQNSKEFEKYILIKWFLLNYLKLTLFKHLFFFHLYNFVYWRDIKKKNILCNFNYFYTTRVSSEQKLSRKFCFAFCKMLNFSKTKTAKFSEKHNNLHFLRFNRSTVKFSTKKYNFHINRWNPIYATIPINPVFLISLCVLKVDICFKYTAVWTIGCLNSWLFELLVVWTIVHLNYWHDVP